MYRRKNGPAPKPLLKVIGNRPADERCAPVAKRSSPAIHDAPLSSEEDESGEQHEPERVEQGRQVAERGSSQRPPLDLAHLPPPSSTNSSSTSSPRAAWPTKPALSSSPKRSYEELSSQQDDHLRDEFGFVGSSQGCKRVKKQRGYNRASQSQGMKRATRGSGAGEDDENGMHRRVGEPSAHR